ncbi:MAG: hypothetical protein R3B06_18790 [Kofleriaceae bacterium]
MTSPRLLFVLAAAACAGGTARAPADLGCPSASGVALAMWDVPDGGGAGSYQVRLGFRGVDDPTAPPPGPLAAYQVATLGLGPLPGAVWLLRPALPPCLARVAGYRVDLVDVGPRSLMVSAELADCPPPPAVAERALAWVTLDGRAPAECRLEVPVEVGARRATPTADGFAIAPLTEATALPAAWAAVAPTEPCADCERLWAVASTATAPVVSDVIITDVAPGPDACAVEVHDRAGLFATPIGKPPVALATPSGPTVLVGALVDRGGTRVVLAAAADRWEAIDLTADGATGAARSVQFYVASEEDGVIRSLGPACGP